MIRSVFLVWVHNLIVLFVEVNLDNLLIVIVRQDTSVFKEELMILIVIRKLLMIKILPF